VAEADPVTRAPAGSTPGRGFFFLDPLPCFGKRPAGTILSRPTRKRQPECASGGHPLRMIVGSRTVTDLTPPEGSIFRSLAIRTEGSVYNQTGERVNDCVRRVAESVRGLQTGEETGRSRLGWDVGCPRLDRPPGSLLHRRRLEVHHRCGAALVNRGHNRAYLDGWQRSGRRPERCEARSREGPGIARGVADGKPAHFAIEGLAVAQSNSSDSSTG
jgi:hypothetical protein